MKKLLIFAALIAALIAMTHASSANDRMRNSRRQSYVSVFGPDGGDAGFPDAEGPDGGDAQPDGGDAQPDGGDAQPDGGDAWLNDLSIELNNGTTDEYMTVADSASLDNNANQFSLCGWFKMPTQTTQARIFSRENSGQASWQTEVGSVNPLGIDFSISVSGFGLTGCNTEQSVLQPGVWQHLCSVYDNTQATGSILKQYVDGRLASWASASCDAAATSRNISGTSPFRVGMNSASVANPLVSAKYDHVTFWDVALTQGNVTTLYNNGQPLDERNQGISGLVSAWRIGDGDALGAGGILDRVGTNHGTCTNCDSGDFNSDVPTVPAARWDTRSVEFNVTNERITVPDHADWNADNDSFTICGWFLEAVWTTSDTFVGKIATNQRDFQFRTSSGSRLRPQLFVSSSLSDSSNFAVTAADALVDGVFNHVCVVYDGAAANADEVTFYVNGSAFAETVTGDIPDSRQNSTADLTIGALSDASNPLQGLVDHVTFWGQPLTAANITTLYNGGFPADVTASGISPGPVAYWRLGESPDTISTIDDYVSTHDGVCTNCEAADLVYLRP